MSTRWGAAWGLAWGLSWGLADAGPPPAPPPAPPDFIGSPAGQRILVRIDGKLHAGSYREISELVEARARMDAQTKQAPSKRSARAAVRKPSADFKKWFTVDEPMPIPGYDPQVVANEMLRDLRKVYSEQLAQAMMLNNQIEMERDDEQAAMAAAELLLM